ncbi:hypothetical protein EW026_g1929 [Hermanssonia centrifuga]|uniref:RING-type E3 ubiquitin transferase n=1 Tax=Hermanssonia centrifuga TaxID=98765 RepID=A0A4S4KQJ3_9APHY|nr:hypothetical protein EW026_g1929 [Hermanssonia centrifuga]
MQEEQDTCRICSAPAEPDQPLFYPCKCSGTIRYIHQDCLTTWLAHSKKKTCDVCKHPYSFTKVYSEDMPSRLPLLLLLRRFAQQAAVALVFLLRASIVGLIWLAFLPWATIWTWRMYFTMGDSTAWWLSNRPRPANSLLHNDAHAHQNVTGSNGTANTLFSHPMVRAVSADIVAGQIIATVIVVAFVAVFLLREWISQNARPGVFDDAEAPPEERDEAAPAPAGDHVQDLHEEAIAPRQDAQRWRRRAREARGLPVPAVDHVQDIRAFREEAIALRREAQRLHQRAREAREMPVPVPPADGLLPQNGHVPEGMDIWSRTANSESSGGEDEGGDSERKAKHILKEKGKHAVASGTDAGSSAIYRAPEELEAGSSNLSGYFRQDSPDDASAADLIEDEDYVYFRDVEPFSTHESPTEVAPNAEDTEVEMPGLQQWTDDEFEEPEDGDNIAVVFDGPADGPVEPNDADDQLPLGNDRGRDRPEQQQDMNVVVDLNDNDDMEGGMDEDMEGALEAIGLRGPIHAVLQNVDPVVDSFMFLIARLVVPPLSRLGLLGIAFFTRLLSIVIGSGNATKSILFSATLYNRTIETASGAWNYVFIILISPTAAPSEPASSFIDSVLAHDSAFMRVVDPLFAPIGEAVRLLWKDLLVTWERLALGDGTTEKLFAISLGYMVDILLVALYLNVLTVGSMKSAGRAVRSAVRQQLVVVKVAAFIVVELVVFPLGCGVMLDVCTVSLFPQGSFRSRTAFLMYAPLTTAFYHWVIGTMFMYQFAVLLAGFRSCLRPGALWFIKDPQDQNFHPIRDILERPTLVHIRKLIFSAFMYGLVVACGVATVSGMLRIFSRTIMPFRWKIREPLSTVPIDLLFLHLILPYTLRYFRPKKIVKQAGVHVWKFLAMQLRLSSYLFGGRYSTEEYSLKKWTLRTLISTNLDDTEVLHDGTFRRVPNSDNVALLKDELATVEVDAEGVPVNDIEDRLMQRQNQEAEKAKRSIKDDYTITYMPPRFKYRVITFMVAIWMVCSIFLASSLAIPIIFGRFFFKLFVPYHVHDGYSFIAGFYLLWGCWLLNMVVERMDKHRQRRGGGEPRADLPLYFAKRSLLWLAKASYMTFFLGFVIPTLIAVVVELYIVMPFRQTFYPDMPPRIRIVDMWALGLLYTKIALQGPRVRPVGRITIAGLLAMILLPAGVLWLVQRLVHLRVDQHFLFMHIYPSIFTFTACTQVTFGLAGVIKSWSQTVRDKEFLVEMRLQNLDPEPEREQDRRGELWEVETVKDENEDD